MYDIPQRSINIRAEIK